jgi:hypothetical protein
MSYKMAFLSVLAASALTGTAMGGIVTPPPWTGTGIQGNETSWHWDFTPNAGSNDPSVPTGHGNGTPQIIPGTGWTILPNNPFNPIPGTGVLCIAPGATIEIMVPNFPDPNLFKYIWIQYHWFGTGGEPHTGATAPTSAGGTATAGPWGPTVTPTPGLGGGLVGAHGLMFPFNPPWEIVTITNPDPNNPMYLEWLHIDTICAPSPGAAAMLGLGTLLAAGRRRR